MIEIRDFIGFTLNYAKVRDVKDPHIGTPGSLGIDMFIPNDFGSEVINPGDSIKIPSGIVFRIDGPWGLQVNNKSGIATKRDLIKGAELIDEDYTGETHIHLFNVGKSIRRVEAGEKIIQLVPILNPTVTLKSHDSVDEMLEGFETERGDGGFGSTGTK